MQTLNRENENKYYEFIDMERKEVLAVNNFLRF